MIIEFKDKFKFLSNFHPCIVSYEGHTYQSVEAAYQAQKSHSEVWKKSCTKMTASACKSQGRKILIRNDWEDVKISIMFRLLKIKFTIPELRQALQDTGTEELIEGNWWGDKYWGFCLKTNKGDNHLGKLLMQIRSLNESTNTINQ